jgi:hypothetical protein
LTLQLPDGHTDILVVLAVRESTSKYDTPVG